MGSGTSSLFGKKSAAKKDRADVEAERLKKILDEKELELQRANRILDELKLKSETEKKSEVDTDKERLQSLLEEKERELSLLHQKLAEYQSRVEHIAAEGSASPPRGVSASPFSPTRTNKKYEGKIKSLIVHHDGENCYVPNDPLLPFAPVRLALANLALSCTSVPHTQEEERQLLDRMEYFFYLTCWDKNFTFHPAQGYWNDMDTLGVHLEGVGTKKGSVDIKMKALLSRLALSPADGAAVIVISGDRDFSPEVMALGRAGYYTILLHCGNISRTRVVEESCDAAFGCWFDILARAHPSGTIALPPDRAARAAADIHVEDGGRRRPPRRHEPRSLTPTHARADGGTAAGSDGDTAGRPGGSPCRSACRRQYGPARPQRLLWRKYHPGRRGRLRLVSA